MLMNLHKKGWTEGLKLTDFEKHHEASEKAVSVRSPPSPPPSLVANAPRAGNAQTRNILHQIPRRGIQHDARPAQEPARRQAGPEAAFAGCRRARDGRAGRPELGDGRVGRGEYGMLREGECVLTFVGCSCDVGGVRWDATLYTAVHWYIIGYNNIDQCPSCPI
jgi:hypothetical protein